MLRLSDLLGEEGILHDILVGKLKEGEIDFGEYFGLLITGFCVPLGTLLWREMKRYGLLEG